MAQCSLSSQTCSEWEWSRLPGLGSGQGQAKQVPVTVRELVEFMLQALLAVLNSVAAGQAPVPWGPGVGGSCRKSTR